MSKQHIEFREFIDGFVDEDGEEGKLHKLPAKWEICGRCEGCGTDRGASVECDGGGFTASEWAEQDEDFKQDYLNGVYDQPCNTCKGTGKVLHVDRERCAPDVLKKYDEHLRDEAEYQSMCYYERRMGA